MHEQLTSKQDATEIYYSEMEAARNEAEDAYFKARPQLSRTLAEQSLFRAGFERAFQKLWNARQPEPPSAWQPIETAPHDREVLFWVVPLSADETYRDTSGNPITSGEKPRMMFCRFGRWSSLSKAIYWADVPGSPTVTKSEEPEPMSAATAWRPD